MQLGYIDHSCPYARKEGHGENLARLIEYPNISDAIQYSVQSWYHEIKDYDFNHPETSNASLTGHFTQLIWKSSWWVGMDAIETEGNKTYIVALYYPPGNMELVGSCSPGCRFGLYKQNVVTPFHRNTTTTFDLQPHIHRNTTSRYHLVPPIHWNPTSTYNTVPPIQQNAKSMYSVVSPIHRNAMRTHKVVPNTTSSQGMVVYHRKPIMLRCAFVTLT